VRILTLFVKCNKADWLFPNCHLEEWHLANCHLSKFTFSNWFLALWLLVNRNLVCWLLANHHLVDRQTICHLALWISANYYSIRILLHLSENFDTKERLKVRKKIVMLLFSTNWTQIKQFSRWKDEIFPFLRLRHRLRGGAATIGQTLIRQITILGWMVNLQDVNLPQS